MKVHYINILLFALPLNILEHNQRNHKSPTTHTQTNRSLCECELYTPANYENDPQMKSVMDYFNKQTQQRLRDYDNRMKTARQKCKEQCDKEIQKIILKDKLEKELMDKFATLHTDIQNDAIPTCVCEKSLADKTEKFCLNCGKTMGGVAPGWGLVSGLVYAGWSQYLSAKALQKGIEAGVKEGFESLTYFPGLSGLIKDSEIQSFINPANYADPTTYVSFVQGVNTKSCVGDAVRTQPFCNFVTKTEEPILLKRASGIAKQAAGMAEFTENQVLDAAAPTTNALTTAIIASVVAIVVIILVMVIIYKILRYRRKKKMKKKLQYIKILEE
ncbi:rifin PIR protein, putative [Plasmodium reichenowi]|uniref:Rifin PIR protein, putative n=1 Tax=Plasmodium reichenowi TaxID=5854 RepID=A0A2P9DS92_PLARE|nr:rifin PIR protein, putative [Plasmodium reichenowi]